MDTHLEHRYQGGFGGTTTMLGALKLVIISKLLLFMYMPFTYIIFIVCSCFVFLCASCGNNMLRCSFYQNLYYTCTNSELHLFYIYLHFMLICTHYMHMYRLVLMILFYTCFCLICMLYFMYMYSLFKSNKYTCIPVSLLPSCKHH